MSVETPTTRTIPLRTGIALMVLAALLVIIAYQCAYQFGAFDGLIRARIKKGEFDEAAKARVQPITQFFYDELAYPWFGTLMLQYPTDLAVYQEIIYKVKPDVIIETGTFHGGLTLYLASLLEMINSKGKVLTVDIDASHWKKTLASLDLEQKQRLLDRITFFDGSSTAPDIVKEIAK